MKRCPTCSRTFLDEHLSYCTDDGTPLVEQTGASSFDPQATLLSPTPPTTNESREPPPTQVYRSDEMPGWQTPGSWSQPSAVPPPQPPAPSWNAPSAPPAQQSWSPPPLPNAGVGARKSQPHPLAIASLALGIFSMTIGVCCFMGFATGPVSIVLGVVSMMQMKSNPMEPGSSKGMAITGIATGAAAILILVIRLAFGIAFGR